MSVDADTKKFLEEVKKGKPRRFAMICKGAKILTLVVYKKGSLAKYKKQAKEEGSGQFYHGVIDGQGQNLAFKLQRSDGFDQPPGKEITLKSFLSDEADMQLKPTYEIVDLLPEVPDDDDDPLAPKSQAQGPVESDSQSQGDVPGQVEVQDDAKLAEAFKKRLASLVAQIKTLTVPSVGLQAKPVVTEAVELARRGEYAQANERLDFLEQLLTAPAQESNGPQPNGPQPNEPDPNAGMAFNERLKLLLPKVKAVANTASGEQAKLRVAEAGNAARGKDFAQANALLDEVERILASGSSNEAPTPTVSAVFPGLWEQASGSWLDAIEAVDAQLETLRKALLQANDSELKEIAEFGLNAITGDHKVPLQAAILDIKRAGASINTKLIAQAQEMVVEFRDHIETDEQVEACDENPFGVNVTIRTTLGPALDELEAALKQAFA